AGGVWGPPHLRGPFLFVGSGDSGGLGQAFLGWEETRDGGGEVRGVWGFMCFWAGFGCGVAVVAGGRLGPVGVRVGFGDLAPQVGASLSSPESVAIGCDVWLWTRRRVPRIGVGPSEGVGVLVAVLVAGGAAMADLLVPIDFSDCTYGLVDRAAALARQLGVGVVLLHVTEVPLGGADLTLPDGSDAHTALDTESIALLNGYSDRVGKLGVPVRVVTRHGAPGDTILAAATEMAPSMVMMGTHGRTGVARMLLGSVAEHVLRRARVPVVTVRTQHRPECTPASCATCDTHRTPAMRRVEAELDG
ncbi:MAG: nucleotide-binding universal stress UspA family protein, partial [Myxococcota bacterium]